jgi:hypothetical protein
MSDGFAKIYTSMLRSTVWVGQKKHVKLTWITMLALADAVGYVSSSIPGLARDAECTIEEVEEALRIFLSPDPYSRTKVQEGRRITEADGGWVIINHKKYRELRSRKAIAHSQAQARYEEKRRQGRQAKALDVAERPEEVTERQPPIRSISDIKHDAPDAQKQKQKQKTGSDHDPPSLRAALAFEPATDSRLGAPKDLSGSARATAPPPSARPIFEPVTATSTIVPIGARSHFVPSDWYPKPRHEVRAVESGLVVEVEVEKFRLHEFEKAYVDWDRGFDRWLIKARQIAETDRFKRQQQSARGGTTTQRLQPDNGVTGWESDELADDDDEVA